MPSIEIKNFDSPDDRRRFAANGYTEVVTVGGRTVGRGVHQPGWRWSVDVGAAVGAESCQASHLGYVVSGRIHVHAADGSDGTLGPGDVFALRPGHDAEVVGDEPCVVLDFGELDADAAQH